MPGNDTDADGERGSNANAGTSDGTGSGDARGDGDCCTRPDGGTDEGAVCQGEVPACYCPIEGIVDVLARKYAMQIVCVVGAHGTVRFRDIETHLPTASTSTLSARLDDLREEGLIERTQYDEIPPRVEYSLTDEGRDLQDRLEPLLRWARDREAAGSVAD